MKVKIFALILLLGISVGLLSIKSASATCCTFNITPNPATIAPPGYVVFDLNLVGYEVGERVYAKWTTIPTEVNPGSGSFAFPYTVSEINNHYFMSMNLPGLYRLDILDDTMTELLATTMVLINPYVAPTMTPTPIPTMTPVPCRTNPQGKCIGKGK